MDEDQDEHDHQETSFHTRKAVSGDQDSLGWLVEHLTPLLLAQARYRLSRSLANLYDPEDLVNDVWQRAMPKLHTLRPRENRITPVLMKFLSTVLLNHYNNLVKKHLAGKPLTVRKPGRGGDDSSSAAWNEMAGDVTDVDVRAQRSEISQRMDEALRQLGPDLREIVVLRAIEQVPVKDVARLLRLPETTVVSRFRQAKALLRDLLPGSLLDDL